MFLKIKHGFFKTEKLCSWIIYIFIGAKGRLKFLLHSFLPLFIPTRSRDSFPTRLSTHQAWDYKDKQEPVQGFKEGLTGRQSHMRAKNDRSLRWSWDARYPGKGREGLTGPGVRQEALTEAGMFPQVYEEPKLRMSLGADSPGSKQNLRRLKQCRYSKNAPNASVTESQWTSGRS